MRIVCFILANRMLKQLHINRDSECSGLLLCNHLDLHSQSTTCILHRDLSEIIMWGGGALEEPRVCRSLEGEFRFGKSSNEQEYILLMIV